MAFIELRNVSKVFGPDPDSALALARTGASKGEILEQTGHTIGLNGVSLAIERGETFVVMGLSGCGKSTLIRHFNRLIEPTAGEVVVDGIDVLSLSPAALSDFRRHRISMVFQRFGLFPHRTVMANIAYGLAVQDVAAAERDERAGKWIEAVGLAGYENAYPKELSGGMQQRVGLARALATDPDILLMDEPFSALDPLIRREMQDQLLALQATLDKTIVFITHDLDEALRLGDRVAILKDGGVVQVGGPQDILMNPADDYVADFVKDVNRSRVLTAAAVMDPVQARFTVDDRCEAVLERMAADDDEIGYVVDDRGCLQGVVTAGAVARALRQSADGIEACVRPVPATRPETVIEDFLSDTLANKWPMPVVSEGGVLEGVVSDKAVIRALAEAE